MSIINQSYKNLEILVINDGSSDQTEKIVKSISDKRIKYYVRENKGVVYTRNEGIDISKGDYIALQDADDFSDNQRIEKEVKFLEEHPDHIVVGSFCTVVNGMGKEIDRWTCPALDAQIRAYLLFESPFINGSVMFRGLVRQLRIRYRDYAPAEDYDFFFQLLQIGKAANLRNTFYTYSHHEAGISKVYNNLNQADRVRANIQNYLINNPSELQKVSFQSFVKDKDNLSMKEISHFQDVGGRFIRFLLRNNYLQKAKEEFTHLNNLKPINIFVKLYFYVVYYFYRITRK